MFFIIGGLFICLIICCLGFYYWWFLRTPKRYPHTDLSVLVSPASGKIFSIFTTDDSIIPIEKNDRHVLDMLTTNIGGIGPYTVVSIMMTPWDVHIQRAPSDAKCSNIEYRSGSFLNAISDHTKHIAVWRNEANAMFFKDSTSSYAVVQIAGFVARKIRCFIKKNQHIKKGDPIGFIVLGSQVTMIVDSSIMITVSEGQYVYDGETIIGIKK